MSPDDVIRTLVMAAYEQGWRDASDDGLNQNVDASYPYGRGKRTGVLDVLQHLDPNDLLGLQVTR